MKSEGGRKQNQLKINKDYHQRKKVGVLRRQEEADEKQSEQRNEQQEGGKEKKMFNKTLG